MKFVTRLCEGGERMSDLCREYEISRKSGYKYLNAFREHGAEGLFDQSRAPISSPHTTPPETVKLLVGARKKFPTWGPRKLCAWLSKRTPGVRLPCPSTVGLILKREGLVAPRRRRKHAEPMSGPLTEATAPNEVWCVDFKGQFRLGNGSLCYPLTITDLYSRYLVACVGLESPTWASTQLVFAAAFREFGLPQVIRSDNGQPFASCSVGGLSRLSSWWRRLAILPERIDRGCPQQNGQHERMHRTLKAETTRPAGKNLLQQQERFDRFRVEFNLERPHEAHDLKTPGEFYEPSARPFAEPLAPLEYPHHDDVRRVSNEGRIKLGLRRAVFVTGALAGQDVGIRELECGRLLVTFVDLDLGLIDPTKAVFLPGEKPRGAP